MKAIMLMFDSLNRHMLPPYGCDWVHAPNFRRLAQRTVRFDRAYVGSMPCMPARREIHTGRPEFLHRSWGPLEPFDDSMPELLTKAGVHTHLVSDHYHYWEDLGWSYHTRYGTWDFIRGQEGDPWIGQVQEPEIPPHLNGKERRQDWVNRPFIAREEDAPGARTIKSGLDFLRRNGRQDGWFLHIECFDPHEPWFVPRKYRDLYPRDWEGPLFDWPGYEPVKEGQTPELIQHARYQYAASLSFCDALLGDVLDMMDRQGLWDDTMLIVNTDHGFMLGEHGCWAKNWQPWYEELSHVPLFIWDPRCRCAGESRGSFVQTIDLAPTLLDYFGQSPTPDMIGRPLRRTIAADAPARPAGLFGIWGGHVNVTDGRFVYMRAPVGGTEPFEYTLLPLRSRSNLGPLAATQLAPPFSFTKGCPTLKVRRPAPADARHRNMLFDLASDPGQEHPLEDPALEQRMAQAMVQLMKECDAPVEQYARLGLAAPA